MLRGETNQLMKILSVAYPNTYRDFTDSQKIETMQAYYDFFGEYETPIVVQALRNYIKRNQFPPTIAGLQEQIDLILNVGETANELWNLVEKATRNGLYGHAEEYARLPEPCQRWLGTSASLKELAQLDSGTLNTVIRGQFLKTVGQIKESVETQRALPQEVRAVIQQAKTRMLSDTEEDMEW